MKLWFVLFVLLLFTACTTRKPMAEGSVETTTITVNGENIEMVLVEGGSFMMGCTPEQEGDAEENEKPTHEESVDSFYIGKYEVTQKLWNAVMGVETNPSYNIGCDHCPVERVSWKDAQIFLTKLTILTGKKFRLPTEAEWEYAARGGNRSQGYKYSGSHHLDEVAWYQENYQKEPCGKRKTTHAVGLKSPNELGLYDMSGNVWEWCEDTYQKEYVQNGKKVHSGWPFPGTYLLFRRVLRGGSWGGEATGCRVSYIDFDGADYKDEYGGFRLVMEVQ